MKKPEPEILSVAVDGSEMQYLYYEGDGPTIIFLHATGFLPWLWHPVARSLCGDYRVIAPYFCDHRVTEPEQGGLAWMQLAEDLCEFCTQLRLERPLLVGHSMGATIITLANATHGSLADKMILIEPIFLPEQFYEMDITVEQHPLASKSIKRRNGWDNADELREYLRSRKLFQKWDDEMLELYIRYGMITGETGGLKLACSPRREASLFMGAMHYNPWPMFGDVTSEVMVVEGELSENRQFIDLKKAAEMFPNGTYHMVKDAGHLVPMEKPQEIIDLVNDFFSDSGIRACTT